MQTPGGTAALRTGFSFLARFGPHKLYLPDPTWQNHTLICTYAQIPYATYPYYDPHTLALDFPGMCTALRTLPPHSIVLLHASCHNPTGVDPSPEQWQELSNLIKQRHLIPFFDLAYQGFGSGLAEDVYPIRLFAQENHEMFIAYSYSKNFGLYGERVGLFAALTHESEITKRLSSQFKRIVRTMYSNPPLHGSRIVSTILKSSELCSEWENELKGMRQRIKEMRESLVQRLNAHHVRLNTPAINAQQGIFSFLGLDEDQVRFLRETHAIYMPDNGRINVAGLNESNIDYVAKALSTVLIQA
jgi:aspartate/tyrosine/aromatic aminotransferase